MAAQGSEVYKGTTVVTLRLIAERLWIADVQNTASGDESIAMRAVEQMVRQFVPN